MVCQPERLTANLRIRSNRDSPLLSPRVSMLLDVMKRRPRPLTNLADEDRVVLFPSLGHLSRDERHWVVDFHGDVSAAGKLTLGKRLLLKLLQRSMRASDASFSSELFQERIARFVARDRPGQAA